MRRIRSRMAQEPRKAFKSRGPAALEGNGLVIKADLKNELSY